MNNKFLTKQTYEGDKIQTCPVKGSRKFKDVQARCFLNYVKHQLHF